MMANFDIADLIIGGVLGFAITGLAAAAVGIVRWMRPDRASPLQLSGMDSSRVQSVTITFHKDSQF